MIRTLALFVSALLFSADAVDCSDARPYVKTVYMDSDTRVHKDSVLYRNQYWAPFNAVPGESSIWISLGSCDAGTAGDGPTVDCSSYATYTATDYSATTRVQYQGHAFENRWYANSNEAPLSNEVWLELGVCGSGSTGTVAPTTTITNAAVTTTVGSTTLGTGSTTTTSKASGGSSSWPTHVFAPFVDATRAKRPLFSTVKAQTGVGYFSLGFIVASSTECKGSWGGFYTIDQGPWTGFMTEINSLRASGGDIIVSFGGAAGVELANAAVCQTGNVVDNLTTAYLEVVDTYGVTWLDFDIEGSWLSEVYRDTIWKYRFDAIKAVVAARPNVKISFTLPVLPTGLISTGLSFTSDIITQDVPWEVINVMTMNYGSANCPGDMSTCEISAIKNLAQQLYTLASNAGKLSNYGWSSVNDVYPMVGSCPMIGVNDVNVHIYTLDNARASLAQWSTIPIGWLSMWALARDSPCASLWADGDCSGASVQTADLQFTSIFAPYTSA